MTTPTTKTQDGAIAYARIQGFTLKPATGETNQGSHSACRLVYPDGVTWIPFSTTKEAVAWLRSRAQRGDDAST